jgi:deoxycytidylate deaminase
LFGPTVFCNTPDKEEKVISQEARSESKPDRLAPILGPELVFGLVGALGADLELVSNALSIALRSVNYTPHEIRVSRLLYRLDTYADLKNRLFDSEYDRIKLHMKAGTDLRIKAKCGDILAWLTMSDIRDIRVACGGSGDVDLQRAMKPLTRTAYIVRSIKHPDEIATLRTVYGRAFFVISAYSPREKRVDSLATQIAQSAGKSDSRKFRDKAEELIQIDEQEDETLGQSVRDSFPLADVFVDAQSAERTTKDIERFVRGVFGDPFITPTRDEFAMFHAFAAALRSADLGRQVGVSITSKDGDIIAVGCNDVPKFGGGLYWSGDDPDHRDFKLGFDSSVTFRQSILSDLVGKFLKAGWSSPPGSAPQPAGIAESLIKGGALKGSQILGLLEFGRSVHAEMSALTDSARRGVSVLGAALFSTTFPCHLCARHIVSAGLHRVVYIEPYPKSMAAELYGDSIVVDPSEPIAGRVNFEPFVGIAPIRYSDMFANRNRKDDRGRKLQWTAGTAEPRLQRIVPSYLLIEDQVIGNLLPKKLKQLNIVPARSEESKSGGPKNS